MVPRAHETRVSAHAVFDVACGQQRHLTQCSSEGARESKKSGRRSTTIRMAQKSHQQAKAPLHDSNESPARATCPCARVTTLSKVLRRVAHHHLTATSPTPTSCRRRGQQPSSRHAQAPPPHREQNATFLSSHHMPPPPPRAQAQARSRPSP